MKLLFLVQNIFAGYIEEIYRELFVFLLLSLIDFFCWFLTISRLDYLVRLHNSLISKTWKDIDLWLHSAFFFQVIIVISFFLCTRGLIKKIQDWLMTMFTIFHHLLFLTFAQKLYDNSSSTSYSPDLTPKLNFSFKVTINRTKKTHWTIYRSFICISKKLIYFVYKTFLTSCTLWIE